MRNNMATAPIYVFNESPLSLKNAKGQQIVINKNDLIQILPEVNPQNIKNAVFEILVTSPELTKEQKFKGSGKLVSALVSKSLHKSIEIDSDIFEIDDNSVQYGQLMKDVLAQHTYFFESLQGIDLAANAKPIMKHAEKLSKHTGVVEEVNFLAIRKIVWK